MDRKLLEDIKQGCPELYRILEQAMKTCPTCKGNKFVADRVGMDTEEHRDCPTCDGTGRVLDLDRLVVLDEDQTPPELKKKAYENGFADCWNTTQRMLKANFKKVKGE